MKEHLSSPNFRTVAMKLFTNIKKFRHLIFYLILWVGFAFVYKYLADSSNGEYYIFQEDIRIDNQIQQFTNGNKLSLSKHYLSSLFKTPDRRPYFKNIEIANNKYNILLHDTIGENWAAYYQELIRANGYNDYYFADIRKVINPLKQPELLIDDIDKQNIKYSNIYQCKLYLYTGPKLSISADESTKKVLKIDKMLNEPDKIIQLWLARKPSTIIKDNDFISTLFLQQELMNSIIYLDDSREKIDSIVKGKYKYPIIDFLYFSAVTISTLGYGDILPNNSKVRIFVMIETLLGVITIGCFLSSLYQKNSD